MLLAVDGMDSWFPRNASVGQRWRSAVSGPSCARLLPLLLPCRRLSWRYAGLKLSYSFATSLQVYDSQACGRSAVIQERDRLPISIGLLGTGAWRAQRDAYPCGCCCRFACWSALVVVF